MISTIATVIFIMDKNEETVYALTSGLLSWNVLVRFIYIIVMHIVMSYVQQKIWQIKEFVYSAVLTVLCAISFWLAFGYTGHVPKDGRSAGYVFAGVGIP
jgi:uncharacterized membrane-anchored protein YitT (DUF2179 family)